MMNGNCQQTRSEMLDEIRAVNFTVIELGLYLDINPDSNGHTLIIPKKHYTDLVDIDDATLSHIMSVARNLKKLLEDKLKIDGLTLIQNNGDVQEVKHYHLHLKPYYKEKQEILPIDDIYNKIKMS